MPERRNFVKNCDKVAKNLELPHPKSMQVSFDSYNRSFDSAQTVFGGGIDTSDRSQLIVPNNPQEVLNFLTDAAPNRAGFYPVRVEGELLRQHPALYVGRALLMHNSRLDALSPVIITAKPDSADAAFQISMFDQPYDPEVGFSPGMHWNVSVKAQTSLSDFGGHTQGASGLEQGHFAASILGARNNQVAAAIIDKGDRGTHGAVLDKGVAETLGQNGMLPVPPKTRDLPRDFSPMLAYWHKKLQTDNGPIGGDYPDATRLMLGAGLNAIGEHGLSQVERLTKDAARP